MTMAERLAKQKKHREEMKKKRDDKKAADKKAGKKSLWEKVKGVGKEIKEGAKGSKAHQESVAKKDKGTGGKNWYPGKYAKKFIKGEDIAVPKGKKKADAKKAAAKKAADKSWSKAVKKQKKLSGGSKTLSSLVAQRKGLKKGTAEYAKVQNAINAAYGVKKVHKATKESPKPKTSSKKGKGVTVSSVEKKYKKPIDKKNMQITESALKDPMKGTKKPLPPAKSNKEKPDLVDRFKEAGSKERFKKALGFKEGGQVPSNGGGNASDDSNGLFSVWTVKDSSDHS